MRCKIVRSQKLMWLNTMKPIKSQKASILHYRLVANPCDAQES